ncbi:histamine H2 receptor-like [Atheta coriaria]|uniref:histamine H2 receptor-like n=1 Tax=Dalotia coriaria TaxID=877792 RepID=UPI0031F34EDB
MADLDKNYTLQSVNGTNGPEIAPEVITWIVIDSIIICLTLAGNILTICAIKLSKKISELLSNRYIFSLAVSDLLVGLTLPYHLAFTIDDYLGSHESTCILRFVLIILACSSSIYNLLAIAADRYIAIVLPFFYSRHMTRRVVWSIVFSGWCLSIGIASMPIYWNTYEPGKCTQDHVLPAQYVNFIITPMFLSIWLAMSVLYMRIWREAAEHAKRLRTAANFPGASAKQRKSLKENKSVQMVLLILGCFSLCWFPYFFVLTYMRLYNGRSLPEVYEAVFTLAVSNSWMNPLIYAWKSKNYRNAFWCLLKCKSPRNLNKEPNFITDHIPGDKSRKIITLLSVQVITISE